MIKRLSHISLRTHQLETLIQFYCHHLNCRIVHEFRNDQGERYGAFLAVGESPSFLELFNDNTARPLTMDGPLRHLCFEVNDIVETAETFTALGFSTPIQRGKLDRVLQFTIIDPDGNEIEFHQYDDTCALWTYINNAAIKDGHHEQ